MLNTEFRTMKIDIDKLTESDLTDLNNRVVARLKFLHQMQTHARMLDFSIGETVAFQPDGHPVLTGIISKYNRKTVTVITTTGQQWNVSYAPAQVRVVGSRSTWFSAGHHHAQEIGISDCVSPKSFKCIMVRRRSGCRSNRAA